MILIPYKQPQSFTTILFRIFALIVLFSIFIQAVYIGSLINYVSAYTEWGLTMSIIMFILIIIVDLCPYYELKRLVEVFIEATFCAQVVIVVVFWTLLVPIIFFFRRKDYKLTIFRVVFNIEVHILPALLTFLEVKNSKVQFKSGDKPFMYIPLLTYGFTAFLFSYLGAISKYPVFDFKDWKTIPCCVVACLLNELGFYLGSLVNKKTLVHINYWD